MATIVITSPGDYAVSNGDRVVIDIDGGGEVRLYAASPNVRNFQVDFTGDDVIDKVTIDLSTFGSNDLQIQLNDYDETDEIKLDGAVNAQIDPGRVDQYIFDFVGSDGQTYSGRVRLKDKGEKDFTADPQPIVICFVTGTIIDTDLGPTPIEALKVGSLVRTLDHGLQTIRWIGQRELLVTELKEFPELQPVRVAAGALGDGLPWADLTVSPQHRIRLSDWRAQLYFGEPDVLVPAKALVNGRSIRRVENEAVTYWHLMFDRHELVWSNGVLSESLHPGEMAKTAIFQMREPELPTQRQLRLSRPSVRVREARVASL